AGNYVDRREAIAFASKHLNEPNAMQFYKTALKDLYHGLRNFALAAINLEDENVKKELEPVFLDLAKNDKKSTVRASAISKLGEYKKMEYAPLFKAATKDSSYTVAGMALNALMEVDNPS